MAVLFLKIGYSGLQAQKALIVKENSGAHTSFTLTALRKLTFPAGSMTVIKTDGSTSTYTFNTTRSLTFSDLINNVSPIVKKERGNLTLYPNPVVDQLKMSYKTLQEGSVQAGIIDFQGRVLHRQTISCQEGTNQAIIPVAQLKKGLYLFRLQNGNNVETIKFIKN
jgi:Secretion system C-terminal sorting domain